MVPSWSSRHRRSFYRHHADLERKNHLSNLFRFPEPPLALVACLTIILVISLLFPPLPIDHHEVTYNGYASKCADAERELARFLDTDKTDTLSSRYEIEKTRNAKAVTDWCSLSAQYIATRAASKSADFARLSTIATIAAALFLVIALVQTGAMLREAKRTTAVTREIGIIQTRANLVCEEFSIRFSDHGEKYKPLSIGCRLKNVGSTPATQVEFRIRFLGNLSLKVPTIFLEIIPAGEKAYAHHSERLAHKDVIQTIVSAIPDAPEQLHQKIFAVAMCVMTDGFGTREKTFFYYQSSRTRNKNQQASIDFHSVPRNSLRPSAPSIKI